jgi:hypothetical protein
MNSDIESFHYQLLSITQDAPGIANGLSDAQFNWRPAPSRWSVGDCFAHLNESARTFVPAIDRAIERARAQGLTSQGPFVFSAVERIVLRLTEPPPRLRTRAPKALRPPNDPNRSAARVMHEFKEWQAALDDRIQRADGLDLKRARERSPAVPLFKWSLGTLQMEPGDDARHHAGARAATSLAGPHCQAREAISGGSDAVSLRGRSPEGTEVSGWLERQRPSRWTAVRLSAEQERDGGQLP